MKAIKLANVELEKFLREKKVYQKFIKYSIMKNSMGVGEIELLTNENLRISASFWFDETKEGLDFWYNLQDEFLNIKTK